MSQNQKKRLAPFISVLILVSIAVTSVFFKMEVVRQGYELLSLGHGQKISARQRSTLDLQYANLMRPQRLDSIATQHLSLARAHKNQVVVMASVVAKNVGRD
jgi:hypothetical protein